MTVFVSIVLLCGHCVHFLVGEWVTKVTADHKEHHALKLVYAADLIQKKQLGFQKLIGFTVGLQA